MRICCLIGIASIIIMSCDLGAQGSKSNASPTLESLAKKAAKNKKNSKLVPSNSSYNKLGSKELNALFTKVNARGMWVNIPKRSIIYVPPGLKKHIADKPVGKYAEWKKFLQQNRSILYDFPVTISQAHGKAVISKSQIEAYKSYNKIVIATYRKSPITVANDAFETEE